MPSKYIIADSAEEDLKSIFEYIEREGGTDVLDQFAPNFFKAFDLLAEHAGIGHYKESVLPKDYRFHAVARYLIVYRWQTKPIEIIAIVHGARDLPTVLEPRKP